MPPAILGSQKLLAQPELDLPWIADHMPTIRLTVKLKVNEHPNPFALSLQTSSFSYP